MEIRVGADTMTPNFVPDLPGNYLVQLVVTDEDGLVKSAVESEDRRKLAAHS
jgi:hypothetical protein